MSDKEVEKQRVFRESSKVTGVGDGRMEDERLLAIEARRRGHQLLKVSMCHENI